MRDHDLELIAALVEGRLEDETQARDLIASSDEAREEYEAQKLAYESLRSIGAAHLTENERAALHRDVWTELRGGAPVKAKTPWYYRWAPVAAGLFVVVGVAAVLSGGGQEAATTFRDIASELGGDGDGGAAATSTTAADAADLYSGGDDAGAEAPATDTTQAMTDGTFTAEEMGNGRARYAADAARVREGEFTTRLQDYEEASDPAVETCLERAGLTNYRPVATLVPADTTEADVDETIVVSAPEQSVVAEAPLAFVDLSTCDLVYLDEVPD
jgi:hypothetical protein